MQRKKLLAITITAAMMAGIMAGCQKTEAAKGTETSAIQKDDAGSRGTGQGAAGDAGTKAEDVTITFGFWGDMAEAQMKQKLAEQYMAEHPNVKIELEYTDGASYLTKMQTWFSSNTLPDVFGIANDQFSAYKGNSQFEDLAPYIEKDGLSSDWDMNTLKSSFGDSSGKIAAAPFLSKTFAMAYNKDLFDKAGIPYPTDDWTEADMLDAAKKITALSTKGNKIYGLRWGVRPPEFYRNLYGNMMYDFDTYEMKAEGNKEFKHAVSLFADTIKDGLAPDETSGAISAGGFETGMYGMQLSATWDIATFQSMIGDSFKWDVVMLPMNQEFNTRMLTTLRSNGWCMNSASGNKDVCWDFIKYLSASKDAARAAQDFGIPALLSYGDSDEYLNDFGQGTAYNKKAFSGMLDWSTQFNNMGAFAEVNDAVKSEYELLLSGKITIDEMIAGCQKQGQDILSAAR